MFQLSAYMRWPPALRTRDKEASVAGLADCDCEGCLGGSYTGDSLAACCYGELLVLVHVGR